MRHYLVTNTLTGHARIVTLDEAARIIQLTEEDIERALEENGMCEAGRHTISDADVFDLTQLAGLTAVEA